MENKRKLILEIGEKIISEKGYTKTTIEEITKKAKIAKGTFYIYFKNKEEFFPSIIEEALDQLIKEIKRETDKIDDFFGKMKKGIEMYFSYFEKRYSLFKILIQEKPFLKRKEFINFWERFFNKWDFIKKGIENAIKEKKLKEIEPDDIIYSLLGILHGNIHRWILNERKYSLKDKTETVFEIIVNGIKR